MRCAIRASFLASAPPPLPAVTRYRQLLIRSRRRPHRYTVYSTSIVVGRTNITQVSRASRYWLQLVGSLATCCDANTNVVGIAPSPDITAVQPRSPPTSRRWTAELNSPATAAVTPTRTYVQALCSTGGRATTRSTL